MSSLWTPGGEHRVPLSGADSAAMLASPPSDSVRQAHPEDLEPEEAEMAALQQELAQAPAAVIVANHAVGLFQLAALHLSQSPPNFSDAQLAIDAMGALVVGLRGRLGQDEPTLVDALSQIRLAFVQVKNETR